MTTEYFIRLPFPPSLNSKAGLKYKPKDHVEAFNRAAIIAASICDGKPLTGSIHVTYYFQKGDRKACDIQNFSKTIDDGITCGGLWEDDSLIDEARQVRLPFIKGEAWLYIHIKQVDPMSGLAKDKLKG